LVWPDVITTKRKKSARVMRDKAVSDARWRSCAIGTKHQRPGQGGDAAGTV
jgi:hypothetical protein